MKRNFAHNAAIALLTITTTFFAYGASAQKVPVRRSPVLNSGVRRPALPTPGSSYNPHAPRPNQYAAPRQFAPDQFARHQVAPQHSPMRFPDFRNNHGFRSFDPRARR